MPRAALLSVLTVLLVGLAACGNDDSSSPSSEGGNASAAFKVPDRPVKAEVGEMEGKLSLVAWAGYAEDGSTDKAVDWVTPFEKKTGCEVSTKTAATSDEMVTLMNQGGYDLVTASGDASLRLIAGKAVQPIDTKLVPSFKTVDSRLQSGSWHTINGVHYGTPYQWGPNVLMYNTKDRAQILERRL